MRPFSRFCKSFAAALVAASALAAAQVAQAQDAAGMSCDQLWYARNQIYARNGYCFKTPQAIATFGYGCFPPFGKLSRGETARINELQYWERRNGC